MSLPVGVAAAGPSDQLKELRGRIGKLEEQLNESEGNRTEAADALRASERAISKTNRRLFELNQQQKTLKSTLRELETKRMRMVDGTDAQQRLLARLLYQQYLSGQPEPLRLLLNQQDPSETARQMRYLGYVSRARADLIAGLKRDLSEIDRIARETAQKGSELARLQAQEATEKHSLEQQRRERAETLKKVSDQVESQRREMGTLKRNEEHLTRLMERLARELARTPREPRQRNEQLPEARNTPLAPFAQLKGRLRLPVLGQLANRYGALRSDSGLSWKGLFIAAREGQEVRAVATGRVVYADWLRGFGNLLIIDHGDGYMSLYGNNEALYRQVGDVVKTGDAVAAVGATGGNPETGLYFELRFQGKSFDPLAWVTLK